MSTPTPVEAAEQLRISPAISLSTACVALGISQATGSRAVSSGTFPVPVVRMGARVIVPTAPLRELLDTESPGLGETASANNSAAVKPAEVRRKLEDFSDGELLDEIRKRMR